MFQFLRRNAAAVVARTTFCDRCAQVCTPQCRAIGLREHARTQVLSLGALR